MRMRLTASPINASSKACHERAARDMHLAVQVLTRSPCRGDAQAGRRQLEDAEAPLGSAAVVPCATPAGPYRSCSGSTEAFAAHPIMRLGEQVAAERDVPCGAHTARAGRWCSATTALRASGSPGDRRRERTGHPQIQRRPPVPQQLLRQPWLRPQQHLQRPQPPLQG